MVLDRLLRQATSLLLALSPDLSEEYPSDGRLHAVTSS